MSKAADGRGSIHRGSSGGWEGWVSTGQYTASGKPKRKHVRGRTKAEVAEKVKAFESAREAGVLTAGPDEPLLPYLERWVRARAVVVRPSTISGYQTDLKHVRRSVIGTVRLRALTAEHIEQLYASVLRSGCSVGTVAHVRRTVSAALNSAARRGQIPRNPVPLADMPRADEEHEIEPYDAAEIAALLTAARCRRNGVRWSLAFLGLRQGEALGLRWDDLDLDAGELRVRHTLTWLKWRHG